jgi:hypothetical protein
LLFEAGLRRRHREPGGRINVRGGTICRLCHCSVEACVSNDAYHNKLPKFLHGACNLLLKFMVQLAGKVDLHHG